MNFINILISILCFLFCSVLHAKIPKQHLSTIRIATANLTTGKKQSYTPGHGIRIMQASQADIFLVQEFNYKGNSPKDLEEMVEAVCGSECDYFREEDDEYNIPNGIISRYEIIDSGSIDDLNMPNRGFAWAKIQISKDYLLTVFSVHLYSKKPGRREKETAQLFYEIENHFDDDFILIGGDFNTRSCEEKCLKTLYKGLGQQEKASGPNGIQGTNASRKRNPKPYDLLIQNSKLSKFEIPVDIRQNKKEKELLGVNIFAHGFIFDTRDYDAKDPILTPALKSDSAEAFMQHQLVIKDYQFSN